MNEIRTKLNRWLHDTRGASLVEYIIVLGVVALLAVAAFETFGTSVRGKITQEAGKVNAIKN